MFFSCIFIIFHSFAGQFDVNKLTRTDILFSAACCGNQQKLLKHLENGYDINTPLSDKCNALIGAVWRKDLPFIELLVDHGMNVNLKRKNGRNALNDAAKFRYFSPEIFSYLAQLPDIDVNIQTIHGATPLHTLCLTAQDRSEFIALLLTKGADLLLKNEFRSIPLDIAHAYGNKKNIAVLWKPFFEAVKTNNFEYVKKIAKAKNLMTITDEQGNNLLHCALIYGSDEMVGFLLSINWDLMSQSNNFGEVPLQVGVTRPDLIQTIFGCTERQIDFLST